MIRWFKCRILGWHRVSFVDFPTPGCVYCPRRWER